MNGEKSGMRGEKSGENGEKYCMDTWKYENELKCSPQLRVETERTESASTCDSGCDASFPDAGSLPLFFL